MSVQAQPACGLQHFLLLGQPLGLVLPFMGRHLHLKEANDKQQAHPQHNGPDNPLPARQRTGIQLHG